MIEANIIHAAYLNNVTKLLFLGSSCIYPKMAPQPLKEKYLLSGYLESTNQTTLSLSLYNYLYIYIIYVRFQYIYMCVKAIIKRDFHLLIKS
jgi:nucleoside-diphosphate-sugar epimerase